MSLTESQISRYERQILLPEVGGRGQEALLATTVRVRGCGEAADELATYLAAGGVGKLLLDTSFPTERRRFLESMNADVSVGSLGQADVEIDCGDSKDRFLGAQRALQVMLRLVDAGDGKEWREDVGAWWVS